MAGAVNSYSMCWCGTQRSRHRWRPGLMRPDVPTCPTEGPVRAKAPPERDLPLESMLQAARAEGWDARDKARPQYLGPDAGHYPDDCMGWEDCRCASYPNPYREESQP